MGQTTDWETKKEIKIFYGTSISTSQADIDNISSPLAALNSNIKPI